MTAGSDSGLGWVRNGGAGAPARDDYRLALTAQPVRRFRHSGQWCPKIHAAAAPIPAPNSDLTNFPPSCGISGSGRAHGPPGQYRGSPSKRWRARMKRTVPERERITTEWVSAPLPVRRTPRRRKPSVTPVAANMTSPVASSSRL
jgi:hypothetical protein